MRSPSERLTQLLTEAGLCSRAELQHCEPIVRRLSHDLPDFDSVWLDALVQQRFLTPWQAERIQADEAEQIVVCRYRKQQRLGRATFLATEIEGRGAVILKSVMPPERTQGPAVERGLTEILAAVDRARGTEPEGLVLPREVCRSRSAPATEKASATEKAPATEGQTELFLVSGHVPGWSMEELLIRGGRLPSTVVAEIGRELLANLAWLESVRLLHGDLVTRNVRLDARGGVHLVDCFVRRLQQPQFALTARLTLRDSEGIAPEQVGTGRVADARSELYSLGCLLWQLLTSRPVVLSADPVTRLMKQKDHDIVDVRGPVPDCPEWMSRLIQSMTRRSPELRPGSAVEVLKQWKAGVGGRQQHCRALARQMPDHAERSRTRPVVRALGKGRSRLWPAAASVVLVVLVLLVARSGVLPKTLRVSEFPGLKKLFSNGHDDQAKQPLTATITLEGPQPPPDVDADGVIRLESGRTYIAASREFPGALRILCEQSPTAAVLVNRRSAWLLKARMVELRGVNLSMLPADSEEGGPADTTARTAQQLLAIQSAALSIVGCVIQSPASADEFAGVGWYRTAGEEGSVMIGNTVFAGGGYAVSFSHPPRRCEFDNVLLANRGGGILCEFRSGDTDAWDVACRNVTQRFGFSLIDALIHADGISRLSLGLTSSESVYAPQMAILRLQAPASWRPDSMRVQYRAGESGTPAVVPPSTLLAVYIDKMLGQPVSLPESQITDNSLLLAELVFKEPSLVEPIESEWAASSLEDFEGPKLTIVMPGIDVRRLPRRGGDSP